MDLPKATAFICAKNIWGFREDRIGKFVGECVGATVRPCVVGVIPYLCTTWYCYVLPVVTSTLE